MKKKQITQYEEYLNNYYSENMSLDQALEHFIYLTVKSRAGGHCTRDKVIVAHHDRKLGTLLKRYDSVAFNAGFNDFKFKEIAADKSN